MLRQLLAVAGFVIFGTGLIVTANAAINDSWRGAGELAFITAGGLVFVFLIFAGLEWINVSIHGCPNPYGMWFQC